MISGSAALRAASAVVLSPEAIASSTLRTVVRMRERRAVLISVRRAITRAALRAEDVLAICLSVMPVAPSATVVLTDEKERAAKLSPPLGRLIGGPAAGVNARNRSPKP